MGVSSIMDKTKINEATKALKDFSKTAKDVKSSFKDAPKDIEKTSKSIENLGNEGKEAGEKLSKGIDKGSNSLKNLQSFLRNSSLAAFIGSVKELASFMEKAVLPQSEYIENLNFLDQAYNNSAESGLKLLDTLEKAVGYDPAGLTKALAMFRQFGNALDIDDKAANRLAENLLKLSIDTKSITGDRLDKVMNRYASAMAGNTRAVRAYGIDVTMAGLQQQALAMGIDTTVSSMTRAEKSILMYITMAKQMSDANGDMSRTVNSVANQYEIFKSQIGETGRLLGGLLIPVLKSVLPLINGVIMAINTLLSAFLSLFGIDASDFAAEFGTVAVDLDDVEDGFDGIGTSATKAGKAAKEAQKSLRGFDKLNVIKTPTSSGSSGGGSVSGGGAGGAGGLGSAYSELLANLDEYNLHLDKIKNKATEVRDNVLRWLGFEKELNEETGKIEWRYQGIGKTIENLWNSFKKLNPLVKAVLGFLTLMTGIKIARGISNLVKALGNSGIGKTVKTILDFSKITAGGQKLGILGGIDMWKQTADSVELTRTRLMGATGLIAGYGLTVDAMKRINDEGLTLGNTLEAVGGGLSNILGGAAIGATYGGGLGAVIGAAIGGVGTLIEMIFSYESELDKMVKKSEESLDEVKEKAEEIQRGIAETEMEITSNMSETNYHEKLLDELSQITDANGIIKQGYEDRAEYILNELSDAYGVEYKLVGNTITNQDEFNKKVEQAIRLKEQEILLEAYKEDYIKALQRQNELYDDIEESEANRKKALEGLDKLLEGTGTSYSEYLELQDKYNKGAQLTAEEIEKLQEVDMKRFTGMAGMFRDYEEMYQNYDDAVTQSRENYYQNNNLINKYSDFSVAVQKGDLEAIDEARDQFTRTWVKDGQIITNSEYTEQGKRIETWKATLRSWKEANDERYETYKKSLGDISNYTEGVTPEIAEKWAALGQTSEEDFLEELQKLPEDVQQQVVSKMYSKGKGISDELKKGIEEKLPNIKIEPELVQPSQSAINLFTKTLKKWLKIDIPTNITASGTTKADGGLYSSGIWRPMKTYANGGFPTHGELFMAREKGPELVGRIGNSTAVMNNDQILDQMTIAVARGMSAAERDTNVNIIAQGDAEGMLNFINFKQISKNRQYGL